MGVDTKIDTRPKRNRMKLSDPSAPGQMGTHCASACALVCERGCPYGKNPHCLSCCADPAGHHTGGRSPRRSGAPGRRADHRSLADARHGVSNPRLLDYQSYVFCRVSDRIHLCDHNTHGRRSDDRNRLSDDGSGRHDDSDNRGADCNHGDGRGIDDRNQPLRPRPAATTTAAVSLRMTVTILATTTTGERLRRSGQVDHDRCDGYWVQARSSAHGDHPGGPEEQEET